MIIILIGDLINTAVSHHSAKTYFLRSHTSFIRLNVFSNEIVVTRRNYNT